MTRHVQVSLLTADPARLGDAIRYLEEEARKTVEAEPGNEGTSIIANSELGVAVISSYWVSGDALRESEKILAPIRHKAAQLAGGTMSVERFEIARFVRTGRVAPGNGVRLTRADTDPKRLGEAISAYEDTALPWLTETDGFVGALLLVDRRSGRSINETIWRDEQTLAASRSAAAAIRVDTVAATDSQIRAVEEYRLLFNSAEPA